MKWTRTATALLLLLPSALAEDGGVHENADPSGLRAADSADPRPSLADSHSSATGGRRLRRDEKRRQRNGRHRNEDETPLASLDETSSSRETRHPKKEKKDRKKRATPTAANIEGEEATAILHELEQFRSSRKSSNKSSNNEENLPNKRLHVSHVYTYGAPSVVKGPAMSNPNNACIPGLRIYTEDFQIRTCSWWEKLWCTPGGEEVTNVDFASQINVREGYPHPKMSTLVLRLGEGRNVEYTYRACRDYENKDLYNHQWWPAAHLDTRYLGRYNNHDLDEHYEARLRHVPEGVRGPSLAYVSVAWCIAKSSFAAIQACLSNYDQETASRTGGVAADGWRAFAYMAHGHGGGWFRDSDGVYVLKDDRDPRRRRCVVGFQGSDTWYDLKRFVMDSNDAVGYCGRRGVHAGVARELSGITRDPQYAARIVPALETCHEVTCVGHSLGGALCNLFVMCANSGLENLDGAGDRQMWDDYHSLPQMWEDYHSLIWQMPS